MFLFEKIIAHFLGSNKAAFALTGIFRLIFVLHTNLSTDNVYVFEKS